MTRERPRLAEPKGKAKTLRQKDRIRTGLRKVHAKEDAHQRGNRCKTGNLSGSGASSIRRFHFFFEEELCQARQRPQGILCVFPRAITQHGAIVPGKEGMVLWKKRLRRRQKDQRGLSASLFAQKQRVVLPPAGEAPAKRVMREKLSPRLAIVRASPSSVTALAGDRAAPASPAGGSTETLPRHSSKLKTLTNGGRT